MNIEINKSDDSSENFNDLINAFYSQALEKINQQEFEQAIELFSRVLEYDQNFYSARQNRGSIKAMLGDYQGAMADLVSVLLAEPQNTGVLKSLGSVFYHLGDYQNATTVFGNAIKFEPNNSDLHYERGRFKMLIKDYLGAISDFKNAIDLNPNDAEAFEDYNECVNILNRQ